MDPLQGKSFDLGGYNKIVGGNVSAEEHALHLWHPFRDVLHCSLNPEPSKMLDLLYKPLFYPQTTGLHWSVLPVLLCFIEPIVGGMGPGASSLRDC